jgi:DNA-binding NtrC family response regulator
MKTSPSLLILDSRGDVRELVVRTLRKRLGCQVFEASEVEEAIAKSKAEHVDLIVARLNKTNSHDRDSSQKLAAQVTEAPLLFYSTDDTWRFDSCGKHWSVVSVFNPHLEDLVKVIGDAFGYEYRHPKSILRR